MEKKCINFLDITLVLKKKTYIFILGIYIHSKQLPLVLEFSSCDVIIIFPLLQGTRI